jgi:KDO2-lipid IV(A) lauroyltransferase
LLRPARYAVEYAALLALREAVRHLPPARAVSVGTSLGRRWARAGGPRCADAETNLRLAFPEWSEARRREVLEDTFAGLGRHLAEVCTLSGPHRDVLLAGVEVEGHAHYEEARRRSGSGGMIVLTAHFGSWELCAAAMAARGYPVSAVRHGIANPWVDAMVSGWRRAAGVEEIRMGRAGTGVFRALSRGRAVAMLLDQNAHRDEGVFAPFFGHPALTRSGPARIAMNRDLPVLPVFIFRQGLTPGHVVRMMPPLELESELEPPSEDSDMAVARNVGRMNAVIEEVVREAPDHWMWPHRRYKTQPEGRSSPYPPRRRRRRRV